MRLTTRLMQLASWLLLQRAVNDGEMSDEQARIEKDKVRLDGLATATDGRGLGRAAGAAQGADRRARSAFRSASAGSTAPSGRTADDLPAGNPVREQIGRIAEAFGRR